MKHQFSRNELAIGQQGLDLLKQQTVVILGVEVLVHLLLKH